MRDGVEAYLGRAVFADSGAAVVRVTLSRIEEQGKLHVVARVSGIDNDGDGNIDRADPECQIPK